MRVHVRVYTVRVSVHACVHAYICACVRARACTVKCVLMFSLDHRNCDIINYNMISKTVTRV